MTGYVDFKGKKLPIRCGMQVVWEFTAKFQMPLEKAIEDQNTMLLCMIAWMSLEKGCKHEEYENPFDDFDSFVDGIDDGDFALDNAIKIIVKQAFGVDVDAEIKKQDEKK